MSYEIKYNFKIINKLFNVEKNLEIDDMKKKYYKKLGLTLMVASLLTSANAAEENTKNIFEISDLAYTLHRSTPETKKLLFPHFDIKPTTYEIGEFMKKLPREGDLFTASNNSQWKVVFAPDYESENSRERFDFSKIDGAYSGETRASIYYSLDTNARCLKYHFKVEQADYAFQNGWCHNDPYLILELAEPYKSISKDFDWRSQISLTK